MRWRRRGQVILGYVQNSTLNWNGKGQLIHRGEVICGVVTTRFGNVSSHFATSMVLSWAAHLETYTHSPHRCSLGLHSHDALLLYYNICTKTSIIVHIHVYILYYRRTHTNL